MGRRVEYIPTLLAAAAATVFAAGCGYPDADDPLAPGPLANGVQLTASVVEIASGASVKQMVVRVTASNPTSATVYLRYEACPVRIRLYYAITSALAYDEGVFPCSNQTPSQLEIPAGQSRDLSSGVRNPWTMSGDSLPATTYRVAGLVHLIAEGPIEVDAGLYQMPECIAVFPPVGVPFTECTYPPAGQMVHARASR